MSDKVMPAAEFGLVVLFCSMDVSEGTILCGAAKRQKK